MLKALLAKVVLLLPFIGGQVLAEPLIWQARSESRHFILLGSIHAGKPELYPLPVALNRFWQQADGLIVEANILNSGMPPIDTSGPNTKQVLDQEGLQRLRQIAKQAQLPLHTLQQSPPWLTAVNLQVSQATLAGLTPEYGIDLHLLKKARRENLPIFELESIEQQLSLLKQLPDHGTALLTTTLFEWDSMSQDLECMVDAWKQGDSQEFQRLLEESSYGKKLDDLLIYQRNLHWAEKLADAPEYHHGTFIVVVGALHLVGKHGVPALLQQQGFKVEQLTQSSKANCEG